MTKIRRQHSDAFKFKVALEAIKGNKTQAQLVQEFSVAESLIQKWKAQLIKNGPGLFSSSTVRPHDDSKLEIAKLYEKVGKLVVERDFLKKTLDY